MDGGDRVPGVINKDRFVMIPSSVISDISVSSSKQTTNDSNNVSDGGKSVTSDNNNMGFLEAALNTIGTGISVLAG